MAKYKITVTEVTPIEDNSGYIRYDDEEVYSQILDYLNVPELVTHINSHRTHTVTERTEVDGSM